MVSAPSPEIVAKYLKYQVGRASKTLHDFHEFREFRENRENRGGVGWNFDMSGYFVSVDIDGGAYQFVVPETPGSFQTSIRKSKIIGSPKNGPGLTPESSVNNSSTICSALDWQNLMKG